MNFDIEDNWNDVPELANKKVIWTKTRDINYPYHATADRQEWKLRVNKFPDEPLYTLIIDNKETIHFNDWPPDWKIVM